MDSSTARAKCARAFSGDPPMTALASIAMSARVDGAAVPGLVERERAVEQRPHGGQVGDQLGTVEAQRRRPSPHAAPVQ